MTGVGLAARLAARIRSDGPMPFAAFMDAALYDPAGGFYASGGTAGRRGDFLTSPEVGPLFGAVVARALDRWWDELGRPVPFVVVDAGAGPGTLARSVLAASPGCLTEGALEYVAVERSAALRRQHEGLAVSSRPALPDERFTGVVLANELLDNLAVRLAVHDGGWREAYVDVSPVRGAGGEDERFVEVLRPFDATPACLPALAPHGARAAVQHQAAEFVADGLARVRRGRVVVIDYTRATGDMAARPWRDWLRTYRGHERGGHYLTGPGTQDITTDVALDQLPSPSSVQTQAEFLSEHGLDDLVEQGRRAWVERAAAPDLDAFRARSRVREAEALTDPAGLGGFTVAQWILG